MNIVKPIVALVVILAAMWVWIRLKPAEAIMSLVGIPLLAWAAVWGCPA